ncbi:MAG: hypothetical protein WKG01_11105 [Kofleriaceae bacterium]
MRSKQITSALPEAGPHPDYPTPVTSGTDKIFTLEDPDRGPRVPTTYGLPPRGSLSWSTHAHCEVGQLNVACGSGAAFASWRVGRRGKELIVAESMLGSQVVKTYVLVAKPDGTPIHRVELDMFSHVVEMRRFTLADRYSARRPSGGNGLDGCGSMAIKIDKQRRVSQQSCLQWLGQPMRDTTGVAAMRVERDARRITIAQHFLGLDGRPIANIDGVTALRFDLDKFGRSAIIRYRDADDKPVPSSDGCYGWHRDYDARGLEVKRTCLDFADRPQNTTDNTAIESYRYDARGCLVASRYATADGRPAANRDNVHGLEFQHDSRCQAISKTCVSIVEQPVACGLGRPARTVYAYDHLGNVVSQKHYSADGAPGGDAQYGVFELRSQYDAVRNAVGESCYDSEGKPIACATTGFHAKKLSYDDAGRMIEERYFDTSGAATTNAGAASRRTKYDSYDHVFESVGFDADGKLIETMGMTTRRVLYDTAHRRFAMVLLDKVGRPANYTGGYVGVASPGRAWHAVRIVRGTDGTVTSNRFFDAAGQLLVTHDCRRVTCFD